MTGLRRGSMWLLYLGEVLQRCLGSRTGSAAVVHRQQQCPRSSGLMMSLPSYKTMTWSRGSLSTKDAQQSTEGYPTIVDLSMEVRVIRNRMVTQGVETAI